MEENNSAEMTHSKSAGLKPALLLCDLDLHKKVRAAPCFDRMSSDAMIKWQQTSCPLTKTGGVLWLYTHDVSQAALGEGRRCVTRYRSLIYKNTANWNEIRQKRE